VYLILAVLCSTLNEWLSGIISWRSKLLASGIQTLLSDKAIAALVMNDPLIRNLAQAGKAPSYIPSRTFALALLDVVAPTMAGPGQAAGLPISASSGRTDMVALATAINALPEGDLKKSLTALIVDAGADYDRFCANIENWFDDMMDRVSGWYKRWSQIIIIAVATIVVVWGNVDTISFAGRLWADPALRSALVAVAVKNLASTSAAPQAGTVPTADQINGIVNGLGQLDLPLFWRGPAHDWIEKIAGLLLTIVAVSMGAPAWYDILGRVVNMRNAGSTPPKADGA
jgi:hypothetical protein